LGIIQLKTYMVNTLSSKTEELLPYAILPWDAVLLWSVEKENGADTL